MVAALKANIHCWFMSTWRMEALIKHYLELRN
ncbi:hypothetical protein EE612_025562 [Oryza sativa]|nr:hypothetical protein EE612_025562 [Oryza sativa]